jgi:tripartite-type tricarboxylate transporter receptor subunit TctC
MLMLTAAFVFAAPKAEEPSSGWNPTKPITIVVPWGAGGSTDQVTESLPASWKDPSDRKWLWSTPRELQAQLGLMKP